MKREIDERDSVGREKIVKLIKDKPCVHKENSLQSMTNLYLIFFFLTLNGQSSVLKFPRTHLRRDLTIYYIVHNLTLFLQKRLLLR